MKSFNIPVGENVRKPIFKVNDVLHLFNGENKYIVYDVVFSPYKQKYFYVLSRVYNNGFQTGKYEFHGLRFVESYYYL